MLLLTFIVKKVVLKPENDPQNSVKELLIEGTEFSKKT